MNEGKEDFFVFLDFLIGDEWDSWSDENHLNFLKSSALLLKNTPFENLGCVRAVLNGNSKRPWSVIEDARNFLIADVLA